MLGNNGVFIAILFLMLSIGGGGNAGTDASHPESEPHFQSSEESDELIADKEAFLSYLKSAEDTPLSELSDAGLELFVDSLLFTDRGLASFDAGVLEQELTPTQIYAVLELFGLEWLTPSFDQARVESEYDENIIALSVEDVSPQCDYIEYAECSPPATCESTIRLAYCVLCNCGMDPP